MCGYVISHFVSLPVDLFVSLSFIVMLAYNNYDTKKLASPAGDTPTLNLLELTKIKGTDDLNVIQKIAAGDYKIFGMHLLQDENGVKVDLIMKNHSQGGAEGITCAIFQKWLIDGPEHTRTYEHLMQCLRKSGLGALADDIAKGGGKSVHNIPTSPVLPLVSCP